MTSTSYQRVFDLFYHEPVNYCTASDYLGGARVTMAELVAALQPLVDAQAVGYEGHEGEIFIRTAPQGRPITGQYSELGANMWEHLRRRNPVAKAAALVRAVRQLETVGWKVEVTADRLPGAYAQLPGRPNVGVEVKGGAVIPVLDFALDELTATNILPWQRHGMHVLAVVVRRGELETLVTKVKKMQREGMAMYVLALEAPRYDPLMLSPDDVGLEASSVQKA